MSENSHLLAVIDQPFSVSPFANGDTPVYDFFEKITRLTQRAYSYRPGSLLSAVVRLLPPSGPNTRVVALLFRNKARCRVKWQFMGAKSWTTSTLADCVMEAFDFDLDRLWAHLQLKGNLPGDLPDDWDPIGSEQGALQHLARHSSMPVMSKGRPTLGPCKTCGVAKVALGCLWAVEGPALPHSLSFAREMARAIEQIVEIHKRLVVAGRSYGRTQATEFRQLIESQEHALAEHFRQQHHSSLRQRRAQKKVLEENLARLAELQTDPGLAGVWDLSGLGMVDKCLTRAAREMRVVIDDVLVDLRGVLDVDAWSPLRGSKMKVVTLVEKTLREEGFSWREIADLVEEDDSREAVDRVRARVEGRGGKAIKKAR